MHISYAIWKYSFVQMERAILWLSETVQCLVKTSVVKNVPNALTKSLEFNIIFVDFKNRKSTNNFQSFDFLIKNFKKKQSWKLWLHQKFHMILTNRTINRSIGWLWLARLYVWRTNIFMNVHRFNTLSLINRCVFIPHCVCAAASCDRQIRLNSMKKWKRNRNGNEKGESHRSNWVVVLWE